MALINCPECNKQISDKANVCVGCGAPVEKPRLLKIGNLEIAPNDFPSKMNWQDAINACKALNNGWRLPSKDELYILYKNMDKIGGFSDDGYWSATEIDYVTIGSHAWVVYFVNVDEDFTIKGATFYVRAVRSF